MKVTTFFICFLLIHLLPAQTFTESPQMPPFDEVSFSSIAFSDVDMDNDQDVLITGKGNSSTDISKLYLNDGNNGMVSITESGIQPGFPV